jgi:hypothetical protein
MIMTKDELDDKFDSISFKAPKTIAQMKAWHHFATVESPQVNIYEIFALMEVTESKLKCFKEKMAKGLTKKENLEFLGYLGCHSFDIRYILSYFRI